MDLIISVPEFSYLLCKRNAFQNLSVPLIAGAGSKPTRCEAITQVIIKYSLCLLFYLLI